MPYAHNLGVHGRFYGLNIKKDLVFGEISTNFGYVSLFSETTIPSFFFSIMDNEKMLQKKREREKLKVHLKQ